MNDINEADNRNDGPHSQKGGVGADIRGKERAKKDDTKGEAIEYVRKGERLTNKIQ